MAGTLLKDRTSPARSISSASRLKLKRRKAAGAGHRKEHTMLPAQLKKEEQRRASTLFFIGQDVSAQIVIKKKTLIKELREKKK